MVVKNSNAQKSVSGSGPLIPFAYGSLGAGDAYGFVQGKRSRKETSRNGI